MSKRQPQQLVTVLTPDDLLLEWEDSEDGLPETSVQVQKDIHLTSHREPDVWFFKLGFTPEDV
ncbi:MAG: hypothetical protein ACOC0A_02965, partial [Planctomycetota bacterium]